MSEYHQQRAQEIVRSLLYVTVATASSGGEPWNSPVYSAYDDHANFYWTSSPLAQHSRNIDQNGRAFLAIYDSMVPAGKGEGVYIEATAAALIVPEEINEAKGASRGQGGRLRDGATRRGRAAHLSRDAQASLDEWLRE